MKFAKMMVLAVALMFTVGCGQIDRVNAQMTGYSTKCINGVTYIQFASGATVMVDQEGKPVKC